MDKLSMHSKDIVEDNISKIAELFPNTLTEVIKDGKVTHAIDFDVLRQELSDIVVDGPAERYHFTWPDKRKSILLANSPIAKTLRPCREESVDFDTTENLYIEGDNLDALKLLQETYLGKIDIIYIDPPYNTGNDFVYKDNFKISRSDYLNKNEQIDQNSNRLICNIESNGRFHTNWLDMIYPRIRLAKDLLSPNGLFFVSIGDEEVANLRKICDEIFGEGNFRNQIIIRRGSKSVQSQFDTWERLGQGFEYILFYSKTATYRFPKQTKKLDNLKEGSWNNHWRGTDRPTMRYELFDLIPSTGQWRWGKERSEIAVENYKQMLLDTNETEDTVTQEVIDKWWYTQPNEVDLLRLSKNGKPEHYVPPTDSTLLNNSWIDLLVGSSSEIITLFKNKVFDTAKLTLFMQRIFSFADKNATILDFFSGSATTAHAVMKSNYLDNGRRKYILVQLPEIINSTSDSFITEFENICEIGKERIRRAGNLIKKEAGDAAKELDIGFRVLKVDSSNMQDVYYSPGEMQQSLLDDLEDNIKHDRTSEDLLFQVMLDLGVMLSSKIEEFEISGKKVFSVADGDLIACFDSNISDEVVTEIAKRKPHYSVFRDSGFAKDSVGANFDQIFDTYSPQTIRKVL